MVGKNCKIDTYYYIYSVDTGCLNVNKGQITLIVFSDIIFEPIYSRNKTQYGLARVEYNWVRLSWFLKCDFSKGPKIQICAKFKQNLEIL